MPGTNRDVAVEVVITTNPGIYTTTKCIVAAIAVGIRITGIRDKNRRDSKKLVSLIQMSG